MRFPSKAFAKTWLLPPGVSAAGRRLAARARAGFRRAGQCDPRVVTSAATNARLKDRHLGRRCFILATGPSISTQDLSGLKDELCIGVSFFHLHEAMGTIQPRYHVLVPNHRPFDFGLSERYHQTLLDAYKWDVDILVGHSQYEYSHADYFLRCPPLGLGFSCINYCDFNCLDEGELAGGDGLWDISGRPFGPRTVLYSAIQVAYYLGCREIYLLGCDHNYLEARGKTDALHFYAEASGNRWDKEHLAEFTSERWFYEYYRRWKDYRLMRQWLEPRGVVIRNATPGSHLDVFPSCALDEVLA